MHPTDWRLINGEKLEAIPAALARARGNATARTLSNSEWLLRRKRDGRFVAVGRGGAVRELQRGILDRAERLRLKLVCLLRGVRDCRHDQVLEHLNVVRVDNVFIDRDARYLLLAVHRDPLSQPDC